MSYAREFFNQDDIAKLEEAIKQAEQKTSGEICLHIDYACAGDPVDKAKEIFVLRQMHKTKFRNAVLFYLAIKDHKYAIWGDEGINEKLGENFWQDISLLLLQRFKLKQFVLGLEEAILLAGVKLAEYFPDDQKADHNELSNELGFGKD